MGVIFQSGIAIGAVPGFSNFGVTRGWLLGTEAFGDQPAWDNGVMTLIVNDIGVTNFISVLSGDDPDFGLYINGQDSKGINQSSFLSQAIGNVGTMTISQGASSITIGFDETTFQVNNYSAVPGIKYDNNGTPPNYISGSGVFYGFNNAGYPNTEDPSDQYNAQPSNAQVLTLSIAIIPPNITPTATPTPTATTAGPTPTTTVTPTSTATPTVTPTNTVTPSVTPTNTPTPTSTDLSSITTYSISGCTNLNVLVVDLGPGLIVLGDVNYYTFTGATPSGCYSVISKINAPIDDAFTTSFGTGGCNDCESTYITPTPTPTNTETPTNTPTETPTETPTPTPTPTPTGT